ncbi:hypothetical protein YC2023_017710 [Brassica napus]
MEVFTKAAEYMEIPVRRTDDEPLQKLFMSVRNELNLDLKNMKQEQAKFWKQHPAIVETELLRQAQLTRESAMLSPALHGISEEIPRKHKIGFPRNFLGIYRRNSEEISIRRNILRKFRGKMCSSEKTDEFRGNIIAVGEPLGDFTKFRGNSDELAFSVRIPSEFPRSAGRI